MLEPPNVSGRAATFGGMFTPPRSALPGCSVISRASFLPLLRDGFARLVKLYGAYRPNPGSCHARQPNDAVLDVQLVIQPPCQTQAFPEELGGPLVVALGQLHEADVRETRDHAKGITYFTIQRQGLLVQRHRLLQIPLAQRYQALEDKQVGVRAPVF
jgi:hypothetical protein